MLRRQRPLWPNLLKYTDLIVALSQFGNATPLSYSIPYGLSFNILCSLFQNDCSGERADRFEHFWIQFWTELDFYFLSFKQDNLFSIGISHKSKMRDLILCILENLNFLLTILFLYYGWVIIFLYSYIMCNQQILVEIQKYYFAFVQILKWVR